MATTLYQFGHRGKKDDIVNRFRWRRKVRDGMVSESGADYR